jgi:hypothetical protein
VRYKIYAFADPYTESYVSIGFIGYKTVQSVRMNMDTTSMV